MRAQQLTVDGGDIDVALALPRHQRRELLLQRQKRFARLCEELRRHADAQPTDGGQAGQVQREPSEVSRQRVVLLKALLEECGHGIVLRARRELQRELQDLLCIRSGDRAARLEAGRPARQKFSSLPLRRSMGCATPLARSESTPRPDASDVNVASTMGPSSAWVG